jgi:hypothetical protein
VIDCDAFLAHGFVRVRGIPADRVAACHAVLLDAATAGRSPGSPVARLRWPRTSLFRGVATSPALTAAYDELIGAGRWTPPDLTGGTLVARFPSDAAPSDAGWHIEGNWSNGTEYCTNVHSDGRGLFALFLFSDVTLDDAPMGMLPGSHLLVPDVLAPHGRAGLGGNALVRSMDPKVLCRQASYATGEAGDVYLCHPFLIHTGTWPHRGQAVRLAANLKIEAEGGFVLDGSDPSLVARAIVAGLSTCGCRKPMPPADIHGSCLRCGRAAGRGSGLGR